MRTIPAAAVIEAVAAACETINIERSAEMAELFARGAARESSPAGAEVFRQLEENARVAAERRMPICQDCGLAVVFAECGEGCRVEGGLRAAVDAGVRLGYERGYLRKSVLAGFARRNTKDNTPAILHTELVPGERLVLHVAAKGGGSENMSRLAMLAPADGLPGVKRLVYETVRGAGSNPCPPIVLGVGIGGNFETCALLAKRALMRDLRTRHADPEIARLEAELLEVANATGVGPQGFGGEVTCLGVNVETAPCHMASFPVAVNVDCHAHRHARIEL